MDQQTIKIALVGNCQTLSLYIYLYELLDVSSKHNYEIKWIHYTDNKRDLEVYLKRLALKFNYLNIVRDHELGILYIKNCDYIIYQPIAEETSPYFNYRKINSYCKNTCIQISFISIYIPSGSDYDTAVNELKRRENDKNVVIKVSNILETYKDKHRTRSQVVKTPIAITKTIK